MNKKNNNNVSLWGDVSKTGEVKAGGGGGGERWNLHAEI